MPSLFKLAVKNRRKKNRNKTRGVRENEGMSVAALSGIESNEFQQQHEPCPVGTAQHQLDDATKNENNDLRQQGLLRVWSYQGGDCERTNSTISLIEQCSLSDTARAKERSGSVDSTNSNLNTSHSRSKRQLFRRRRKPSKTNAVSSTPDTVASDASSSPSRSVDPRTQRRRPTPQKLDFDLVDGAPNARRANHPPELDLQQDQDVPVVEQPKNGKNSTNNAAMKNHGTKTVIMNGDIVVCNSLNGKTSSETVTIASAVSSISKAKAIRRETERNARAAAALDEKANELFERGYFDRAMACYTKALKLKRRTFAHLIEDSDDIEEQLMFRNKEGDTISDPQALVSMATSINNIGYLRQRSGDATPEETMAAYKKSLKIKRRILGNDSLSVGKTLNNIGSVHYLKRDFDKALPAYEEALEIMKANLGDNHPDVATVMSNIGDVYLAQDDRETSLDFYRKALAIRWEAFGGKSPRVVRLLEKISNLEIGDRMSSRMNKSNQTTLLGLGDDVNSELMVGSGFQPLGKEFKDLQEQVQNDIDEMDQMERNAKVELFKDRIIIVRGMRDVWNGGSDLLDNDSVSVLTALSRASNITGSSG